MELHLQTRDKAVLTTLVTLLVLGGVAATILYFTQRADNAYMAMAHGQYKLAHRFYTQEADAGSPQAINQLANLHYLGLGIDSSTNSNKQTAAQLYLDASSKGFAPAQLNLGHLYRQGIGVPQDPVRAFGWYTMSDIHGSAWAEQYLRHTAVEFTLTPGQINSARESWPTLSALVKEGL